jgi:hypothetical protein
MADLMQHCTALLRSLRLTRGLPWLVVLAVCWLIRPVAYAGNDDGVLVGGQAALTGGAVTATVSDGTAAWYNPAGLAQLQRQSLDLNASVYGINLVSAKHLLTLPDGTQHGASVTDWLLLPAALSYSRLFSKRVVGSFGIFIPKSTDFTLQQNVTDSQGTHWSVGFDQLQKEYDYIATVGIRVSDTLRVGVALHGIYISTEETRQVGAGNPADDSSPFVVGSEHRTTSDYGLRIGLGVQWTPRPNVNAGLSLQTPTLTGFREIASSSVGAAMAQTGGNNFSSMGQDGLKSVWELSTPFSMRGGVAIGVRKAQLLIDGSLISSLKSNESDLNRKWHGNARLGFLLHVSDRLTAGAGAFTDLNSAKESSPNFIGVAGGVRLSTDYHIEEGHRALTFITTLGGRYAYGFGPIQGIRFEGAGENLTYTQQLVKAHVHELAFNLGGGVTF